MTESAFVVPSSRRLTLSGGRWVEVKDQLTVGEIRRYGAAMAGFGPTGERRLRMTPGFAQVMSYLLDWNFTDPSGKHVSITGEAADAKKEAALDMLSRTVYDELETAIAQHIDARAAELEDAKKKTDSPPA